jgi:hypothetical protein
MDPRMSSTADPYRAVDWRWQLGVELAEDVEGPFRCSNDVGVREARRFWTQWRRCRDDADRRLLAGRMPSVYHAFSIYRDPGRIIRPALEARLLADESPDAIADKQATAPSVVQAYECLFYDVRNRLRHRDYIVNKVIGPRLHCGEAGWDHEVVWKFFGFVGGPLVLDVVMDTCHIGMRPASLPDVPRFFADDSQATIRCSLAVAARALWSGDPAMAAALIRATVRLTGKEDEDNPSLFARHVKAMLDGIPWMLAADGTALLSPKLAEYDGIAAELRDNEMLLLETGHEVAGLETLKDLTLPR